MRYVVMQNPEPPPPNGYHHYPLVIWDKEAQRIVGQFNTNAMAEERTEFLNWYCLLPIGERTGEVLKKVRALHSTAHAMVIDYWGRHVDQEEQQMILDLQTVDSLLSKWKRTGSTPRRD